MRGMTRRLAFATLAIVALIAGGFGLAVSSLAQPHSGANAGIAGGAMAGMDMPMGPAVVGPSAGATITISNFTFTGTFTVAPGSTVTVKNSDTTTHTLTANGGAFNTGNIAPGTTASFTAPSTAGAYGFHCAIHASMTGTLTVSAPASLTVPALTKHALVDTAYTATATASGGNGTYSFSVSGGTLPPGLSMSTAGAITGKPTTAGAFPFTLNATDTSSPALHGSVATSIVVDPMTITTKTVPSTGILDAYSVTLHRHGGKPGYTWTVITGSLPTGITLSAAGVLSGAAQCVTPTASCAVGSSTFTVQVADHGTPQNTAQATFSIKVLPEKITTTSLPGGTVGQVYAATQLTKFGGGTAVTWTVSSGHLPPGLMLSSSGQLTGTPTSAGSFVVHIRVAPSDAGVTSPTATKAFTIVIATP